MFSNNNNNGSNNTNDLKPLSVDGIAVGCATLFISANQLGRLRPTPRVQLRIYVHTVACVLVCDYIVTHRGISICLSNSHEHVRY